MSVGDRNVAADVSRSGGTPERTNLEDERARLLAAERAAQAEAEAAQRRVQFLAEASAALSASLDYDTTLATVARLAVPMLADWCAVDLVDDGSVHPVALAHADPTRERLIRELWERYPPHRNPRRSAPPVLQTGRAEIIPDISDAVRRSLAEDDDHLRLLSEIGTRCRMTVPLLARGRTLGAIIFGSTRADRRYGAEDLALAEDLARRCALAVDNALLFCQAQDALARRESLVRVARRFGAEGDPEQILAELAHEAVQLVLGSGGEVFRWDPIRQVLVATRRADPDGTKLVLRRNQGAVGRAVALRGPVIVNDYQREIGAETEIGRQGAQAAVAVPLVHEGRLLGALSVYSLDPKRRFRDDDAEILELLAGMAAAALVGLESARREAELAGRLDGVTLAARELAHLVNNTLTLPVGAIELLLSRADLPADIHELLEAAAADLDEIADQVRRFQQVVRVETKETPVGPSLDLDRSAGATSEESGAGGYEPGQRAAPGS